MKEYIKENYRRILFIVVGLIPFGWGSVVAISNYINYSHFRFVFMILVLFYIWIYLIVLRIKLTDRISEIKILAFLFLSTVLIRYLGMLFLNVQPTSDFQTAILVASKYMDGPFLNIFSARNPHWGFYSITLAELFKIFGNSLLTVKLTNIVIAGITSIGIYFLGKKISGSRRFGFLAALIFAFWPADIMYKNLPTGEHIFSMFLPFVYILFIHALDDLPRDIKRSVYKLIFAGILLGLMDFYKPISIILIIAFSLTIIFFKVPAESKKAFSQSMKGLFNKIIPVIFMILAFWIAKESGYLVLKSKSGFQPNRNFYVWSLRIGMDIQNAGKWNENTSIYMLDLYDKNPHDEKLVNSILLNETKDIISQKRSQLFGFFTYKFNSVWKSDYDISYWTVNEQLDNGLTAYDPTILAAYLLPLGDAYLIFTLFFSFIGALYYAFSRKSEALLSIGLFILGFTIMLFFTEIQQRYRSVLVSTIPIFATYGLYAINSLIGSNRKINTDKD